MCVYIEKREDGREEGEGCVNVIWMNREERNEVTNNNNVKEELHGNLGRWNKKGGGYPNHSIGIPLDWNKDLFFFLQGFSFCVAPLCIYFIFFALLKKGVFIQIPNFLLFFSLY